MKHQQKTDQKLHFPQFSYRYWRWMFVDSSPEYIGPPNCVHY